MPGVFPALFLLPFLCSLFLILVSHLFLPLPVCLCLSVSVWVCVYVVMCACVGGWVIQCQLHKVIAGRPYPPVTITTIKGVEHQISNG